MRRDVVLRIFDEAIRNTSPVMVHFGYYPEKIVVVSGPKEPMVKAEVFSDELIVVATEKNMQWYINCDDIKLIQVADINDPRFVKEPAPPTGMYN